MLRRCTTVLLLVCLAVTYGCQKSPEDARKELAALKVNTALMFAAVEGHTESIQTLLAAGANPNLANKDGFTALMFAVLEGHTESIQTLLAAGANPNLATKRGDTALIAAADMGHTEIVRILQEAMADGK